MKEEIINALYFGNHLNRMDFGRAREIIFALDNELKDRIKNGE